jgi:hypothetical protein
MPPASNAFAASAASQEPSGYLQRLDRTLRFALATGLRSSFKFCSAILVRQPLAIPLLSADFLLHGRLTRSTMPARAVIESEAAFQCKLCCKTRTTAACMPTLQAIVGGAAFRLGKTRSKTKPATVEKRATSSDHRTTSDPQVHIASCRRRSTPL